MEWEAEHCLLALDFGFWAPFLLKSSKASPGRCCAYGLGTAPGLLVLVLAILANSYLGVFSPKNQGCTPPPLKGMALIRFIFKGTPQGGVLSPFLWNLVFNSLITKLQDLINNYEVAQGFADDLAGVMTVQDLQVILRRTQAFMDTIIRWCNDHHLELSSSKTCIIIFTWKRKFHPSPGIYINGFNLPFSSSVKYLGVTLDNKLNWNMHGDNTASKAKSTLLTASRIIGKRWGATGSQARWIFNSIMLPGIAYGCHTWGLSPMKSTINKLQRIDNFSNRVILRCPKFTSGLTMNTINVDKVPFTIF